MFFIYVPVLNVTLSMDSVETDLAVSGLWMPLVIIIFEEIRKYIIRNNKTGFVARWTLF